MTATFQRMSKCAGFNKACIIILGFVAGEKCSMNIKSYCFYFMEQKLREQNVFFKCLKENLYNFPSHNFWFLLQIAKLKSMTIFYGRFNPFTIQNAETDICTRKMTLKKNQPASICIRECFAFRSKSSFFYIFVFANCEKSETTVFTFQFYLK